MKKKLLILVALGIIVSGVIAYTQFNKPHRNIAEEASSFLLTADVLFDAFEENEAAANKKYLDKVITVFGEIVDVDTNQDNKDVVTLEAENAMMGGVICTLKETSVFAIGDEVALKCRCTGFLDDVILVDWTLEK